MDGAADKWQTTESINSEFLLFGIFTLNCTTPEGNDREIDNFQEGPKTRSPLLCLLGSRVWHSRSFVLGSFETTIGSGGAAVEFVGAGVSESFDGAGVLTRPPVRMLMIRLMVQALLIRLTVLAVPIPPVP
jgi:hypothetical protein